MLRRVRTAVFPALIVAVLVYSLLPVTVLAAAPVISSVEASGITESLAVISWTTDINATSNVDYATTSGGPYTAYTPVDASADNTSHGIVLSGLTANTTYYYKVKSSDGVDETTSSEYSFTTSAFTISGVTASSITSDSATITWNTTLGGGALLATSNVEYGLDTSYGSISPSPADTTADNSGHIVVLSSLSANTTYHYRVKSQDASTNEEISTDFTFTTLPDTTAPVISSIAESGVTDSGATIDWNTDEPATTQIEYGTTSTAHGSYDATTPEDATLVTGHSVALSGLTASTTYYYRVISKDSSDNEAVSAEGSFDTLADSTSPVISSVTESGITDTEATINWNTNEPATSQIAYGTTSQAGPFADITALLAAYDASNAEDATLVGSHSMALSGLAASTTYYYRVISKDAAGNEAWSDEGTFDTLADTTAPVISSVAESGITLTEATVTWNTNEPATSQIEYGTTSTAHGSYDTTTPEDASLVGSHSVALSGLTAGTTYYYRVISKDAAGNEAVSAEGTFDTLSDSTAPVISSVTESGITDTGITIDWDTDEPATSQIAYGTTSQAGPFADIATLLAAYDASIPENTVLGTDHSEVLSGLTAGTTYYYRVLSKDAAGNESWSTEGTFNTTGDTTAPVISSVAESGITDAGVTIDWNTNEPATSQIAYGTTSQAGPFADIAALLAAYDASSAEDTTLVGSHSVALSGLAAGTTYYYRVISKDAAGNESWSAEGTFDTTGDTTAPVISSVVESGVTGTEATITWNTNESATSQIAYGTTSQAGPFADIAALLAAYDASSAEDATLVGGHSVALSGLAAGTTYYYRVLSKDAAGNEAWSAEGTFDTTTDTTAPVISSVAESGITNTGITIDWDTNEPATSRIAYSTTSQAGPFADIAALLAAYDASIPENATLDTDHSEVLSGLAAGTTYYYRVLSRDAAGNEAWSTEGTFDTTADTTAPVISSVAESGITDTGVTIDWDTNEPATSQIAYGTTSQAGPFADIAALLAAYDSSSAEDATLVSSHSVALSGLAAGTTYYYRVLSKDAAGNEAWSAEGTFDTTTDTTAPVISSVTESGITDTGVTIDWDTNESATSQITYGTTSQAGPFADIAALLAAYDDSNAEDATLVGSHSMALSGLAAGTTYYYRVISKDAAGNESWSLEGTFDTTGDTTAPVISSVAGSGITETGVTIDWDTNESATSQIAYGTTSQAGPFADVAALLADYDSSSAEDATLVGSRSMALSGLIPGTTYYYRVISKDAAGNEAWSAEGTFDTTADVVPPPVPVLESPVDGLIDTDTTPALVWTSVIDPSGVVTYSIQVDDNPDFISPIVIDETDLTFNTYTPPAAMPDGTYYWQVKAVDGFGNQSDWTDYWTFTIDTTGPEVSIIPLTPDPTNDNTPTLTGTTVDAHSAVKAVEYRVDGGSWIAASAVDGTFDSLSEDYTFTTSALADGTHTVEVRAQDELGNWTEAAGYASDVFQVDTVSPAVTIDELPYHPATPLATPTFTGTATDTASAIGSVEYRVLASDGTTVEIDWTDAAFTPETGDPMTGTYTLTTSALAEGWHLLQVRATDAAGNAGDISYNPPDGFYVTTKPLVRLDTETPMTADAPMWVTEDNRTRDTTPTFKGGAMSGALAIVKVQGRIDGGAWTDAASTPTLGKPNEVTWKFTPASLADGTHTLQVKAIDAAGDETPAEIYAEGGAGYFTFTIDTKPPVISNIRVSDISPDSAVISWTTDEPATSRVEYGEGNDYGSTTEEDTALTTEHQVEITGLSGSFLFFSSSDYHFRVISADDVGNISESEDNTFTTSSPMWAYIVLVFGILVIVAIVLALVFGVIRRLLR